MYVKNTPGVIDFLGGETPTALSDEEVQNILKDLDDKKKKVTKTVIDADLFEKAVGIIIEQSVADEVTTVTTYSQVRTYNISPDAKAKSKSTDTAQVA